MIRRPPRSTQSRSSAASDVYKRQLQDRVDKVADLVGNLMGTSNADEEVWIKRAGIFQQIQTEVGYGFRNAGDLLLVQNDDSKTGKQKELAKEAEELLVLGTAKALIGGSNEDKEAIGVGSIMKIKERLPEELNGLEKKVRDSIIDEPEIQKILDPLDIVRKRVAKAGETGQKVLEDQINKALEKLILLEVDSTKEDQLGMVVEWLGREKEGGLEEKNRVGYNRGNDNYRSESEDVGEIQDDGVPEILEGLEDIDSEARQLAQAVSYTHLRAHETVLDLVCRLLLENKKSARRNTRTTSSSPPRVRK